MRKISTLSLILILTIHLHGQAIKVSENLTLTQLTDKTYIHTCENSNGIIFINGENALIVSTPDSDNETQNLIDWVRNEKEAKIMGYIIDRWHPDAMEGLDIVHKNGIKTYSYELTRQIAKNKGLPIPQIGFDPKTKIQVGTEKVICHFLGEAHTKDGIVVWIPSEQILFGGNEIRNFNGWVGNIADANLYEWSETAKRIKSEYGSARFVIPGHRNHGGVELIDYTIKLYDIASLEVNPNNQNLYPLPDFENNEDFIIKAESDSLQNGIRVLTKAKVIVQDSTKYAIIESDLINLQADKRRIDSEIGRVQIYDKTQQGAILRTNVRYNNLMLFKVDDEVGLRIILRGFDE